MKHKVLTVQKAQHLSVVILSMWFDGPIITKLCTAKEVNEA